MAQTVTRKLRTITKVYVDYVVRADDDWQEVERLILAAGITNPAIVENLMAQVSAYGRSVAYKTRAHSHMVTHPDYDGADKR